MKRTLDVATSWAASIARGTNGYIVHDLGPRPAQPLQLYEFESCPFCRLAREALSMLDLEARIFPCPKGGARFRPEVERRGGKAQFPYLVDPNTGTEMYESGAIVDYLYRTYGAGAPPLGLRLRPLAVASSAVASAARAADGRAVPSVAPAQPLELWSFEASPYCRIARAALCRLEIPYLLHNVAKGSPTRPRLVALGGKMQVPYLVDPNTGTAMYESAAIVAYLEATYGVPASAGAAAAS